MSPERTERCERCPRPADVRVELYLHPCSEPMIVEHVCVACTAPAVDRALVAYVIRPIGGSQ